MDGPFGGDWVDDAQIAANGYGEGDGKYHVAFEAGER